MRIFLTTQNFKHPKFEVRDISGRRLKFTYRRKFDVGKKFSVKDFELMLGETNPSDVIFSTNPYILLMKDFLRNQRFFLERIFKTWEIEITQVDESSLPISFERKSERKPLIWVSRQAALAGVAPSDLDVSLELDYLRSPRKFELMIRYVAEENNIKFDMYNPNQLKLANSDDSKLPLLGYRVHENVEIISGRLVTRSSEIIPVSNYRNEISVHHAGYLARAENLESYFALRTYRSLEPVEKAIFVGYSSSWFHFLIECLPRLISIPSELRDFTPVILPRHAPKQIVAICENLTKSKIIEVDLLEKIPIRQVYLGIENGVTDPLEFEFRKSAIKKAVTELRSSVDLIDDGEIYEKIYMKRPKGLFRPLQNEKRLVMGLTKMGFKVISPESMEYDEVLNCMTNARVVVAESGAALTNVLFTRPGTKIIELYPGKGPLAFWPELAGIADAELKKVMSIRCPIGPRGIARDGIYVSFRKLKKTIETWENAEQSSLKLNESTRIP